MRSSLISVLGPRPISARRLHDDRWDDPLLNTEAAARSFLTLSSSERYLLRWQQGSARSRPLLNRYSTSSLSLGSALRTDLPYGLLLLKSPTQALLLATTGSLIASSPSSRKVYGVLAGSACALWIELLDWPQCAPCCARSSRDRVSLSSRLSWLPRRQPTSTPAAPVG